ncbi:MAG TPA: hypothetical protein P5040_09380, partial [Smithella sp.]|nr:hypothetical protein [Smithella sp.]
DDIKQWDIKKGALINRFSTIYNASPGVFVRAVFTPDGKYALLTGKNLDLWDVSSARKIKTIDLSITEVVSNFSADGSKVASIVCCPKSVALWDTANWKKITSVKLPWGIHPKSMSMSPDGRYAVMAGMNILSKSEMLLVDVAAGEILKTVVAGDGGVLELIESVAFSPDGKRALSAGFNNSVRLWEIPSLREIKRIDMHSQKSIGEKGAYFVTFSPDGKYFLTGGGDGLVKLWDASSGREIRSFDAFSGSLASRVVFFNAFLPDGKHIISTTFDGAIRMWELATGKEVAVFFGFEDGEWLFITAEGYYNSSEKGAQYLKVKYEGNEYTVDQFYDVFYRPDIVEAKLSGQDISQLVSLTMKDVRRYPPPVIESVEQTKGSDPSKAKVCYKIKSAGGGIGEVRIFHNGKLIQSDGYYKEIARSSSEKTPLTVLDSKAIYADMRSIAIKDKTENLPLVSKSKGETFEDCLEIEAIPGDNEVSLTAFNGSNTIQSNLKTVNIKSDIPAKEPHLYILAV